VVVEAGGGFGKTVLAAELVEVWRSVEIEVVLLSAGVTERLLAARLHAAVAHAGFSAAAGAMTSAGEDPQGAIEAAVAALASEQCAIVIDDAHHADRTAAQLIAHLAARVGGPQRLVVLARKLPEGAERLRRAEYLQLSAADLRLEPEETLRLCRVGFGLEARPEDAQAVDEATGGWTAAAVLAVARAARTGEGLQVVADAATVQACPGSSAVAAILEDPISVLSGERAQLAQLGRLTFFDRDVLDATTGEPGFFERCLAAGLPFTRATGPWWELPGPVRDHLRAMAPADPVMLGRAARQFERRGELSAALQLLLACGYDTAAAELFAGAPPGVIDAMDVLEIQTIVGSLGDEAIRAHPEALLHLARSLNSATLMHQRDATLARLEALAVSSSAPALERAIACERAKDLVRDGRFDEAGAQAAELLEVTTSPAELLTRAGALSVLGRSICWRFAPDGRRDGAALAEADDYLTRAMTILERLEMRAAPAVLVLYRAMWIDFARGRPLSALDRLNDGLAVVTDRPRTWALLLLHRAEVELELGRFDDVETTLRETMRVADTFHDELLWAYTYWNRAIVASHRGDAEGTLEFTRLAEQHPGDWWDYASADFRASTADSLGRIGESGLAFEYLAAAQQQPGDAEAVIAMAEAVLLARAGDPELAEERLAEAPTHGVDPREYWRITLFRALAALRRGSREAGPLAARAIEEAARHGLDHLPVTKERPVTEQLLALAVETGLPAARALAVTALPATVRVLGGWELTTGGREVGLPPGQGRQLVKLLAVSGGRAVADQVIDALWPDADPDAGRNRLRTVLNRLRSEAGDVIVREGESLALRADVRVDLVEFESDAARALALGTSEPTLAIARARTAIARYRGDVLPEDPYEGWAARPRERARRTMLALLDLCADVAAHRGDLDEMRRVVETTIDLAPYEDERYLRAASVLLQQGRRGAALTVVRRARSALAEIGLEPTARLLALEAKIVA
jgi:DNA-binding SARP family transcriptional activator/ATP/maltotriose-dependent transcriptional regulator MalT